MKKTQKKSRSTTGSHAKNNQVRIIGGEWRGRKLSFPSIDGLRPTGDRVKETLFNWLHLELPGMACADLFAGSGALGLEALSRGAKSLDLVEPVVRAADSLKANLDKLKCSNGQVFQQTAQSYLESKMPKSLDLVFLDPPFSKHIHDQIIAQLSDSGVMRDSGLIYIESPADMLLKTPPDWHSEKEKVAGHVCYRLFRVN